MDGTIIKFDTNLFTEVHGGWLASHGHIGQEGVVCVLYLGIAIAHQRRVEFQLFLLQIHLP